MPTWWSYGLCFALCEVFCPLWCVSAPRYLQHVSNIPRIPMIRQAVGNSGPHPNGFEWHLLLKCSFLLSFLPSLQCWMFLPHPNGFEWHFLLKCSFVRSFVPSFLPSLPFPQCWMFLPHAWIWSKVLNQSAADLKCEFSAQCLSPTSCLGTVGEWTMSSPLHPYDLH